MANETKVGLLAGLAFITCFAIILANRGREVGIDRLLPQFAGRAAADPAAQPSGLPANQALTQNSQYSAGPSGRGVAYSGNPVAPRGTPSGSGAESVRGEAGLRRADTVARSSQSTPTQIPTHAEAWKRDLERRLNELAAQVADNRPSGSTIPESAGLRLDEAVPLTSVASGEAAAAARLPEPAVPARSQVAPPRTQPPPRRDAVRYDVVSGDTLTKIASRFYGSQSKTVINAIFDANRQVLPSPGELRAGVELTLPDIQAVGSPRTAPNPSRKSDTRSAKRQSTKPKPAQRRSAERQSAESRSAERPAKKAADPSTRRFRWYQIRKNDRYMRIAREQLGSAGRWKEIFELNKDKFPDPSKIREGVRIKLPLSKSLAMSQES